jgi:hypothetical protein
VRQVLIWLTSSLRELTSSEVAAVVGFPFVKNVLRICPSLLVTMIENGPKETIKLAHFTVKEFLIVHEGFEAGLQWYQFTAQLANRCVTAQVVESLFGCPTAEPEDMLDYAWQFWQAHVRNVNATSGFTDHDRVQPNIDYLFSDDNRDHLLKGIRWFFPLERLHFQLFSQPLQPLYCASLLGLQDAVARFWKDYTPLDHNDPYQAPDPNGGAYGGPLEAAACMGHAEVVAWMTDRIDDINFLNIVVITNVIRDNIHQTFRALFRKEFKRTINYGEADTFRKNKHGWSVDVLRFLIEENLASLPITEEMVGSHAHSTLGQKILGFAVRNRSNGSDAAVKRFLTQVDTIDPETLKLFDDPASKTPETWSEEQTFQDLAQVELAVNRYVYWKRVFPDMKPWRPRQEMLNQTVSLDTGAIELSELLRWLEAWIRALFSLFSHTKEDIST